VGRGDAVHRQGDAMRLPYTTFARYFRIDLLEGFLLRWSMSLKTIYASQVKKKKILIDSRNPYPVSVRLEKMLETQM